MAQDRKMHESENTFVNTSSTKRCCFLVCDGRRRYKRLQVTTRPEQVEIQTTYCFDLLTVDLMWISCISLYTASRHVEMLWVCCRLSICCGFVVDLLYSFRLVVGLLPILLYVQLVVQQIHNKIIEQAEFEIPLNTDSVYTSHHIDHMRLVLMPLR